MQPRHSACFADRVVAARAFCDRSGRICSFATWRCPSGHRGHSEACPVAFFRAEPDGERAISRKSPRRYLPVTARCRRRRRCALRHFRLIRSHRLRTSVPSNWWRTTAAPSPCVRARVPPRRPRSCAHLTGCLHSQQHTTLHVVEKRPTRITVYSAIPFDIDDPRLRLAMYTSSRACEFPPLPPAGEPGFLQSARTPRLAHRPAGPSACVIDGPERRRQGRRRTLPERDAAWLGGLCQDMRPDTANRQVPRTCSEWQVVSATVPSISSFARARCRAAAPSISSSGARAAGAAPAPR